MRKRGLLAVLMLIMSGCAVQDKSVAEHNKERRDTIGAWRLEVEQLEAKLADIPLPLKTLLEPQQVSFCALDATAVMLMYRAKMTGDDLIRFYRQEMERAGWKQTMCFVGSESVLVFERPTRSCVVTVRTIKQVTELMIVTGAKTVE